MMKGYEPEQVDHINRVRHDNRWINLREADQSRNRKNSKLNHNNKSGIKGVFWKEITIKGKVYGTWRVRLGKKLVGQSKDFFKACCLRKSAENRDGEIY